MRNEFRVLLLVLLAGCSAEPAMTTAPAAAALAAPVAEQRPFQVESPHGARSDEYYWLRDDQRKDPAVLAHLAAELAYKDAMFARAKPLEDRIYGEILGRIKQDDATVPARKRGYWYYTRFVEGQEYPVYARRKGKLDAPEQVLLDGNALAKGHSFFQVGNYEVSPDGQLLAYASDTVGRRQWVIRIKEIDSGKLLADRIVNAEASLAWTADGKALLWIEKDPQTLLGNRVRKHQLGTDSAQDPIVYAEQDDSFYLSLFTGRSDRFVYIGSESTVSSEWRYADAADPKLAFQVIVPRERDHEYQVEDLGDRFVIRSNWQAHNFRVVQAPIAQAGDRSKWQDVIAHRADAFVEGYAAFDRFLAVEERSGGLQKLRLLDWKSGEQTLVAGDDPTFAMYIDENPEQSDDTLRYVYTSLTTPRTVYDLEVQGGKRTLMKRDPVLGDFDPARYQSEFVWAPARDGKKVPISLVYRKDVARDGRAPLYIYGYGSYGASMDPAFRPSRLSLLDRGVVYAIAHVRGGQELGRDWYEDGKLLNKKHTFEDFIDATEFLVAQGYGAKDKVFASGGSAGGLLMGAVLNMRPDLYRAVGAHVPFVDAVTTMLDESIPLTTNEFDEWGNPKDKRYYDYMLSYSPYDNVKAQAYPALLVTTGLWDSQVQYFEPAKWVARLRRLKTDDEPLLFHVNMEAGHGGKSGRFQRYRETAMEYAFMLDEIGISADGAAAAP
jgi:oligopeptidase B